MNRLQLARRNIGASFRSFIFLRTKAFSIISTKLDLEAENLRQIWDQLLLKFPSASLEDFFSLGQAIEEIFTQVQTIDNKAPSFSNMSWQSRYLLAKNAYMTYKLLKYYIKKSQRQRAVADNDFERQHEMPVSETVGMDFNLKKLMDWIGEKDSGFIGLYGMGGSGKSELMKKLHNSVSIDISIRRHFPLVIWIDMSGGRDAIDRIIDYLREKCKIHDEAWESKKREDKAEMILSDLKRKKYILFVDDVREDIDLKSIGIPLSHEAKQSKTLIATRYESLCDRLNARKFKVECLEEEKALDLLCIRAGSETMKSEPALCMVTRELSQECEGLPLALTNVGQAMAGQKNPQSMKHTLKMLKNFPSTIRDMEQDVFTTLKSSYDNLPTIEQNCFLLFALFPKGEIIFVPDLIRLWIGEGLLGADGNVQDAFNHGAYVVERLKVASLLEYYEYNSVKMHNVIRLMALWLARDKDKSRDRVLVQDDAVRSSWDSDDEKWDVVEKISSVSDKHTEEVLTWNVPITKNVETIMMRCNKVQVKDLENVQFMNKLGVLSLRHIEGKITLPKEIGLLLHLQYLDLSYLNIMEKLPVEMKNLIRLRVFLLEHVHFSLEIIPEEVISCLKSLMVFSFWRMRSSETMIEPSSSSSPSPLFTSPYSPEESFLKGLEELPLLKDISLTLETTSGINKFLSSTKLRHCIKNVGLIHQKNGREIAATFNAPIIQSPAKMEILEVIHLVSWQVDLEMSLLVNQNNIFWQLSEVQILDSDSVTHLTWLRFVPLLRYLKVVNCGFIKVIIEIEDEEELDDIFKNLDLMVLKKLSKLNSIYNKALPFPKLTVMEIIECPKLKKLPLDRKSATQALKRIKGETQWWDNLEWEDPMTREIFQAKFDGDNN